MIYDEITGSRVAQQECKTREQWPKEGVTTARLAQSLQALFRG